MTVWFDGQDTIGCSLDEVKRDVADVGTHFVEVISLLPGMTSVELLTQTPAGVTIRTNEGLMTRTNVSTRVEPDRVVVEFDERYEAGEAGGAPRVTTTAHVRDEFVSAGADVTHHLVIEDVDATGVLGFLYRRFGQKRMGTAFMDAHRTHLEAAAG